MVRIMTEPKNSVIKQYQCLLQMDGVELEFEDEALAAIAHKTIERKTGARGLRSIIEGILTPIMFDAPSDNDIKKVIITRECVEGGAPTLIRDEGKKAVRAKSKRATIA